MPRPAKAAGSVALVTGANRGIGLAFVRELAARGAKKGYAGSVDTRMAAHVQGRKEDPRDIARAGLDALDRGEHVADTDFMAIDVRARYARDPVRYERGMTTSPATSPPVT
jgi:NAD(P)-dependent dehydrogenase (short-subunit alcohol dehydrogenase family)